MTTTAVDRDGLVLFLEGACPDMDQDFLPLYRRSVECTAASAERLYAVYLAVRYIVAAGVEGDIVSGCTTLSCETLSPGARRR